MGSHGEWVLFGQATLAAVGWLLCQREVGAGRPVSGTIMSGKGNHWIGNTGWGGGLLTISFNNVDFEVNVKEVS